MIVHPSQIEEPVTWGTKSPNFHLYEYLYSEHFLTAPTKEIHGHEKHPWLKEITMQKKKTAKL